MQIVYNGPHPEVVVDELDQEQVIVAGTPVEIPDDLAVRLLEQDTWHPVDKVSQKAQDQITAAQATVPTDPATDAVTAPQDTPESVPDVAPDTTTEAVS